jgi:uncharacterized protein (DUF2267 family)
MSAFPIGGVMAMSTTGLEAFDKTLHLTHIWLDEIIARIGPDKQVAWRVLGAVLHVLRDRLQPDLSAHLASQLPLLVRGLYYDQYQPSRQPSLVDRAEDFTEHVAAILHDVRRVDPEEAAKVVFAVLSRHLSAGLLDNVRHALPRSIAALWPQMAE